MPSSSQLLSNEEPWEQLWARLEADGWQIDRGPKGNSFQVYYLPPGVTRRPGFKNRVHYFDSKKGVRSHVQNLLLTETGVTDLALAAQNATSASVAANQDCSALVQRSQEPLIAELIPQGGAEQHQEFSNEECPKADIPDPLWQQGQQKNIKSALLATKNEVQTLKVLLDVTSSRGLEADILATLQKLENLGILPINVLRQTLIGRVVNELMKKTESTLVREKSKKLLEKWKTSVRDGPTIPSGDSSFPNETDTLPVPPGVDPEVWPQLPTVLRQWVLGGSTPELIENDSTALQQDPQIILIEDELSYAARVGQGCENQDKRDELPKRRRIRHIHEEIEKANAEQKVQPFNEEFATRLKQEQEQVQKEEQQRRLRLEEAAKSRQDNCVICLSCPKSHAFVPCGHQCACKQCSIMIVQQFEATCPICRAEVHMVMQIFK